MRIEDIALENGRVVKHKPWGDGATEAYMDDGGAMSESEWGEYCLHRANLHTATYPKPLKQ
jgi:hypothetical protein